MEDMKELLNHLLHREDEEEIRQDDLKKQIDAIYRIFAGTVGTEELILHAGKYDAFKYLHDEDPKARIVGLQRLILESRDFNLPVADEDIPIILHTLEDRLAELLARKAVEQQLERKVAHLMETKHQEYVDELRKEVLHSEEESPETPESRKKLDKLNRMNKVKLMDEALKKVRPGNLSEVVGQEDAVEAVTARMASPYPQHLIFYGPPGVGKTTVARLALEAAKKLPFSVFGSEAPFVECDGTTLRWDNREMTNPLIGSVHDPIYQGAQKRLADEGIPEPKTGLVTEAHGGVLFIDEIGELDPILLNKLLKVLEDKRVYFSSAYYDEENPHIPAYIKKLFSEGAPADFVLIGATTRQPQEISPAIRSRCAEVFFTPLQPEDVSRIVTEAAGRLSVALEDGVADMVSEYTMEGRKAVSLLADAYGLSVYEHGGKDGAVVTRDIMKRVIRMARLTPWQENHRTEKPVIGHVYGLGVAGYWGSTIEIEAAAYQARESGKGLVRFNDTAGSMAKDSVNIAASVVRSLTNHELSDYDLHVNVVGGGNIDGPSAGCAITCAILSAVQHVPLRQDWALTGEISLSGDVKPVGGLMEKAFGAHQAGMKGILIPEKNKDDLPENYMGMQIVPVKTIRDVLKVMMVPDQEEKKS
jgi:ATP-dependent Lon protease